MYKTISKYRFIAMVSIMLVLFAACSKKNRCSDCPKWGKHEVLKNEIRHV